MREILKSASKLVFILMAVTASVALFLGILESQDYMILASMAFSFYFSNKGEKGEKGDIPYLGK